MWPWKRKQSPQAKQAQALRDALSKPPSELALREVFPIFVPASFFLLGNWPGPYQVLSVPGLGLTWAVFQPEQTMRYVDRGMQEHWDSNGIDWVTAALENLRRASEPQLWTHDFRGEDGRIFGIAMMHSDGAGPSRLFLRERLEELFPEGYFVALPEMSCGFAMSVTAPEVLRSQMHSMVERCFTHGTRPLVGGIHPAVQLREKDEHENGGAV